MRFTNLKCCARARAAFTLTEVLAAMVFMAIVIPVAVEGVRVASLAGEVAHRKTLALRVAEEMLNDAVLNGQGSQAVRTGVTKQGALDVRWTIRSELWKLDAMRQITAEATVSVQSQDYTIRLTTLVIQ